MKATGNALRINTALRPAERRATEPQVVALETIQQTRRHRKVDNWLVVLLIAAACLFAGLFAAFTLNPVISTLAMSGQEWTPGAP